MFADGGRMKILDVASARNYSPLTLAFYGDAVYSELVRRKIIENGSCPSNKLHKAAIKKVCAEYQSRAYGIILPMLTDEEADILRRGKNATGTTVPKSSNHRDYHRATAVEALFGYLYLIGALARAEEIFEVIYDDEGWNETEAEASD